MKKFKRIIILIILFILVLICILFVFNNSIKNIRLKNKTIQLVNYIYTLNSGEYYYKNGVLYDSKSSVVATAYYIDGEGSIVKDKYNNISLSIALDGRCVYKTSLGKVIAENNCDNEYNLSPVINKNNSQITFKFNNTISEYMISNKDDFSGKWIKLNKNILVINLYEEGEYYIWFRDSNGNLSETVTFDINCLPAEDAPYDEGILYCTGSTLNIDNDKWIVIEDKDKLITLMRYESLDNKLNHSEEENYKWSTSLINKYLNEEYINTLSDDIKNKLVNVDICDDASGTEGCDSNDGCGGYKKETIEKYFAACFANGCNAVINKYKWTCSTYTKSKVRIISYDEYGYLYDNIKDKELIYGSYWMINSYRVNNGGMSVTNNAEVFINEKVTNKLDVKPVITLKR